MSQPPLFQFNAMRGEITLTPEQIAARKAAKLTGLKRRLADAASRVLSEYDAANRYCIAAIHNDPDFTPAEGWAALGADGVRILMGSAGVSAHVAAQAALAGAAYSPPTLPEGIILTPNADGTVTVVAAE